MQILWNNFLGLGNAIVSLLLLIDSVIYSIIAKLYGLYVVLAQAEIFSSEMYVDISNKVYLIMGVVALFICVYTLLQSVINPDNFKKSGVNFVKKFVIAIIMIIITPAIFNLLYDAQYAILSDNIIQNIFLGKSNDFTTKDGVYATYLYDKKNPSYTAEQIAEKINLGSENGGYDLEDFVLDEDGTSQSDLVIRYHVTDKCKHVTKDKYDYAAAMKSCEKMKLEPKDNSLITSYGNYMAFVVLEAFLHPTDSGDVIVDASTRFDTANGLKLGIWGCVGGAIVGSVIIIVGAFTGPGEAVAAPAGASVISAACIVGGAAGMIGNSIAAAIDYKSYKWSDAEYEMVQNGEFNRITAFAGNDDSGVVGGKMEYLPIVSTICGLFLAYMLFSYCIDLGLRAAKLAFYELLAPVAFLLNSIPGQKDLLANWIKAVLTTWGEVFIRIFTMIAVVYLVSKLDITVFDQMGSGGLIAKAIIVMGLITFARQFPKLLGDITGIKSEGMKLGIMEKLGAGGALAAGALIGGGITAGVKNFTNTWRNTNGGVVRKLGAGLAHGAAGTVSGGFRSAKGAGFKAKSWGDMRNAASSGAIAAHKKSKDRAAYRAAHPGFGGVAFGHLQDGIGSVREWAGLDDQYAVYGERIKNVQNFDIKKMLEDWADKNDKSTKVANTELKEFENSRVSLDQYVEQERRRYEQLLEKVDADSDEAQNYRYLINQIDRKDADTIDFLNAQRNKEYESMRKKLVAARDEARNNAIKRHATIAGSEVTQIINDANRNRTMHSSDSLFSGTREYSAETIIDDIKFNHDRINGKDVKDNETGEIKRITGTIEELRASNEYQAAFRRQKEKIEKSNKS